MKDDVVEINGKFYRKYFAGDEMRFRSTCDYEKQESKRSRVRDFVGRIKRIPAYGEQMNLEIEFDDPDTKVRRVGKFLLRDGFQLMEGSDGSSKNR